MKSTTFKEWTKGKLEYTFGLKRVKNHAVLVDWLEVERLDLSSFRRQQLEFLRELLEYRVDEWNEMDLREGFIGPMMTLIDFFGVQYRYFTERRLSGKIGEYEINGNVDALIAAGRDKPETPFFCFYEYKQESAPNNHPLGQVLVEMLVAQTLHQDKKRPIYGAYVLGQHWTFLILKGKEYSLSESFSAATDEVYDVYYILLKLKGIIEASILSKVKK